jgi:hypothetical protein
MPIQNAHTTYPLWGKGPINNASNTQNNDIIGYTRLTPFFWDTLVEEQQQTLWDE